MEWTFLTGGNGHGYFFLGGNYTPDPFSGEKVSAEESLCYTVKHPSLIAVCAGMEGQWVSDIHILFAVII